MIIALVLLLVAILLGATGQIALKTGLNLLGEKPSPLVVLRSILTPYVFLGFVCYGLSSLLYLIAISRLDLTYAYPMVALSYVIVTFLSWRYLGEVVPALRVGGLAIICVGVLVVALSYRPAQGVTPAAPPALERPAEGLEGR
jgi:drug/metabolite transporter (DMT)-like permease